MCRRRWDRRKRKNRKRKERSRERRDRKPYRGSISLWAGELAIARGHDGLLRGQPEPVVILAAYDCSDATPRPVHQHLVRFHRPRRMPGISEPMKQERQTSHILVPKGADIAILALALEQDGGQGALNLFSMLRDHRQVIAWPTDQPHHFPCPLSTYAKSLPSDGEQSECMIDDNTFADLCRGDDYVGASVFYRRTESPCKEILTSRIASEDRHNDWTIRFQLSIR